MMTGGGKLDPAMAHDTVVVAQPVRVRVLLF